MPYELNDLNKFFSFPKDGAYLNCAAQGPLSKPASQAVIRAIHDKENPVDMDHEYGASHVARCRKALSQLIKFPENNIALANSTSWGTNIFAQGLNLKAGDEIIAFEGQFPSNVAPWELLTAKGVKLVRVPAPSCLADIDSFEKKLSPRTKVASLEWVHFVSGDRIPLEDYSSLCHQRGITVIVDVTQGLGAIPFSMKESGVDAITCSGYKWLYSPYGTGFFALNDKLMDSVNPVFLNWLSLDTNWAENLGSYELKYPVGAKRFDTFSQMGHLNLDGLTASVEWLCTLDIAKNFKAVSGLIGQLKESLNPTFFQPVNTLESERQSLIAAFKCIDVDGNKIVSSLKENKFTICVRNGALRISPSIYNDPEQIETFCKLANSFAENQ